MTLTPRLFYQATKPSRTLDIQKEDDRQYYIDFSQVRGGKIIEKLRDTITWSEIGQHTCNLFTGHIGCGKSTELLRLKKELEDEDFHTIYFESDQDLDMGDLDISDILLVMARRVAQSVESVKNKDHAGSFRKLLRKCVDLLQKEVKLSIKANSFAIPGVGEFEFDTDLEDANLSLSTVFGKITATTKKDNDVKARLRDYLEPKTEAILDVLNEALFDPINAELQRQGKNGLVIIVDNLDRISNLKKLSGKLQSEYIFGERGADLNRLHCHVVYTMPLALRYTDSYKLVKESFKTLPFVLPMVPTYHRDGTIHQEGMELLQQMVLARAFPKLTLEARIEQITTIFESKETLAALYEVSGGHVRNRLRILNPWIITEKSFPLTRKELDSAILNELNEEVQNITSDEWDLLRQVREKKDLVGDRSYEQLIGNLSVYEYRDDLGSWYDINPVLIDHPSLGIGD
ncbi:MAG: ATP-binding protein [Moorea sp. SIO2B7]|nr:ATP-binding protein [Moorena sp. SIO2B7]